MIILLLNVKLSQGTNDDISFAGSLDSNWTVSAVLEKKLNPMPFTLALGAMLNHKKNDFRLGLGFIIG